MTVEAVVRALALPPQCLVGRRVPKTVWPEGLRLQVADSIAELRWEAVLKPGNCGVPAAGAIEVQVLSLRLKPAGKGVASPEAAAVRLHGAVPYPVLPILEQEGSELAVALAEAPLCPLRDDELTGAWLPSLALARQPRASLGAVYGGWRAAVEALLAARITGAAPAPAADGAEARRQALDDHDRLAREIARLRAQAGREKHLGRRADLNLRLQQLQSEFAAVRSRL